VDSAIGSIIVFGVAVTAGVMAYVEWRLRAVSRQLVNLHTQLQSLSENLEGVSFGGVKQGERINRAELLLRKLESDAKRLQECTDQMSLAEGENRAFTQAIRLAAKGADVKEIMETCDLSRSEAELVILLHSQRDQNSQLGFDDP
jgi:AraC-like DNA-binding protein